MAVKGELEERRVRDAEKFARIEEQIGRLISDADSEKETRRRSNLYLDEKFAKLDQRLSGIEKKIYIYAGAIAMLMFVMQWAFRR